VSMSDGRAETNATAPRMSDAGIDAAHDRFGGMSLGAQLVGMLTAFALLLLLGGLWGAAVGTIAYQTANKDSATAVSIGAVIAGIVILFLAFLAGGWTAGRMARYDGGRNGLMTVVWFLILGAVLAALGVWAGSAYNVVANVNLPNWFGNWWHSSNVTAGAVISGIVAILVAFIAAYVGGQIGERYNERVDRTIASDRARAVPATTFREGAELP
jgi:MFS family permease